MGIAVIGILPNAMTKNSQMYDSHCNNNKKKRRKKRKRERLLHLQQHKKGAYHVKSSEQQVHHPAIPIQLGVLAVYSAPECSAGGTKVGKIWDPLVPSPHLAAVFLWHPLVADGLRDQCSYSWPTGSLRTSCLPWNNGCFLFY